MNLWRIRRSLYQAGRLLGDVQAISKGPAAMAKRAERRLAWRMAAKVLRKLD
jgi:hypothetical protein